MLDLRELQIDVFRSSGPDGVVDRTVRVVHLPTGLSGVGRGNPTETDDRDAAIEDLEQKLRSADQ